MTNWVRINGEWVECVDKGGWVCINGKWHWEIGRGEFVKQKDTGGYVWVPTTDANSQES